MSRNQVEVKSCPHCGQSLAWAPEPERIRWYIDDDGAPRRNVSTLGEKLLDSLRTNGQAVYVAKEGQPLRRIGVAIATAAGDDHTPTGEREPIIVTPEDFARYWRRAGAPAKPPLRTMRAGGAR